MVTVSSATSTAPTVFPLIACGSGTGDMISLGCLATGFTPSSLTFSWKKNEAALTDFIQYPAVQKNNVYTGVSQIRVRREDWNDINTFKCIANHPAGERETTIPGPPKVLCHAPTLKVLASSDDTNEASLSCFAYDFSPKDYEIKWLKNEEEITGPVNEVKTPLAERVLENGTKLYNVASFLTLKSSDVPSHTQFTCEFKGKNPKCDVFTNSSVIYNPCNFVGCTGSEEDIHIEGPKWEDMFLHGRGTIKCEVKGNKISVDEIYWQDENGKEITDSQATPTNGKASSKSLDITYDEWSKGIKVVCVVVDNNSPDPLKKTYERKVGKTIHQLS
ncbi:hypothetical protein INR49_011226 [Caranx melampygus]|nr:hypothetical protein INR49_011226 [Caranx melampygus]